MLKTKKNTFFFGGGGGYPLQSAGGGLPTQKFKKKIVLKVTQFFNIGKI
jgi:hypothetical protein